MKQYYALIEDFYIDWFNNYLTPEKMAEHHNMTVSDTCALIDMGRKINQAREHQMGNYFADEVQRCDTCKVYSDDLQAQKRLDLWARLRKDYPAIERNT